MLAITMPLSVILKDSVSSNGVGSTRNRDDVMETEAEMNRMVMTGGFSWLCHQEKVLLIVITNMMVERC